MGLIANRLKTQRIKIGLKQTELAELVKISVPTITRLENGRSDPKTEELSRLAAALNTSIAYLLGETDDPGPSAATIITSEGAIRQVTDELLAKAKQREVESNAAPINPAHMIRIRILDRSYHVCCGSGIDWGSEAINFESSMVTDSPELATRYSSDDLIGVITEGDSMEPHVSDGDFVIFAWREKTVSYAGIPMVVSYNNKMLVRGVIQNSRKKLTLKAHNKSYDDIVVTPDDEFDICGRVIEVHARKKPVSVL